MISESYGLLESRLIEKDRLPDAIRSIRGVDDPVVYSMMKGLAVGATKVHYNDEDADVLESILYDDDLQDAASYLENVAGEQESINMGDLSVLRPETSYDDMKEVAGV